MNKFTKGYVLSTIAKCNFNHCHKYHKHKMSNAKEMLGRVSDYVFEYLASPQQQFGMLQDKINNLSET